MRVFFFCFCFFWENIQSTRSIFNQSISGETSIKWGISQNTVNKEGNFQIFFFFFFLIKWGVSGKIDSKMEHFRKNKNKKQSVNKVDNFREKEILSQ